MTDTSFDSRFEGNDILEYGVATIPQLLIKHYCRFGLDDTHYTLLSHIFSMKWTRDDPYPTLGGLKMSAKLPTRRAKLRDLRNAGLMFTRRKYWLAEDVEGHPHAQPGKVRSNTYYFGSLLANLIRMEEWVKQGYPVELFFIQIPAATVELFYSGDRFHDTPDHIAMVIDHQTRAGQTVGSVYLVADSLLSEKQIVEGGLLSEKLLVEKLLVEKQIVMNKKNLSNKKKQTKKKNSISADAENGADSVSVFLSDETDVDANDFDREFPPRPQPNPAPLGLGDNPRETVLLKAGRTQPPAAAQADFADLCEQAEQDLRQTAWQLHPPEVKDALVYYIAAVRLVVPDFQLPTSDSARKDWYKSLSAHVQDYSLKALARAYPAAVEKLRDIGYTFHRPGSLTNLLSQAAYAPDEDESAAPRRSADQSQPYRPAGIDKVDPEWLKQMNEEHQKLLDWDRP